MNYLKSLLPWIAFAVVATQFDWRWSGLTGLAISAALLLLARREGRKADTLILEWSGFTFFALLTAVAFVFPASPLKTYTGALTDAGWPSPPGARSPSDSRSPSASPARRRRKSSGTTRSSSGST